MNVTEVKEDTTFYFTIDLSNLTNIGQTIKEVTDPSNCDTYLVCHVHPNYGNYTLSLYLFKEGERHFSYELNGWKFIFNGYMHINWNYRLCWYHIKDNLGEERKASEHSDLGGAFYRRNLDMELTTLVRLGWTTFYHCATHYYSFGHKEFYDSLHCHAHGTVIPKETSIEEMGRMVMYRQQERERVNELVASIPDEKKKVYESSIADLNNLCDRYYNQIWRIKVVE